MITFLIFGFIVSAVNMLRRGTNAADAEGVEEERALRSEEEERRDARRKVNEDWAAIVINNVVTQLSSDQ